MKKLGMALAAVCLAALTTLARAEDRYVLISHAPDSDSWWNTIKNAIKHTSGSMQRFAWPAVRKKMDEVLNAYPKVKGLQIMNDEGVYMFSRYAGKWIPDTPARRQAIRERLSSWNAFSNSSPVEGIEIAIKTFWAADKKDQPLRAGGRVHRRLDDAVLDEVDRLNRRDAQGQRKVRIHGIGFPTLFSQSQFPETTGTRFAMLMRILCERNGGAFVALNSTDP